MTLATPAMPITARPPAPKQSKYPTQEEWTREMLQDVVEGHEEYVPLTRKMYHALIDAGYVDRSVELLDGVMIRKIPFRSKEGAVGAGRPHIKATQRLIKLDRRLEERGCHMQSQSPADVLETQEPEPDGAVIRGSADDYDDEPTPDDMSCVIEVSVETLRKDRVRKLPRYARAGIPQYVIENIPGDVLEVHEQPDRQRATYGSRTVLRRGETLDLLLPDGTRLPVAVNDLLPPPSTEAE